MLDKPRILSISNSFDKFSNTLALILDPLFSTLANEIKHPFYVAYVNSEYPDHLPQNAASELYLLFAHWISYFRKVALNSQMHNFQKLKNISLKAVNFFSNKNKSNLFE